MRKLIISALLLVALAGVAMADAITDRIVASLKAQGYTIIQMQETWLGRIWILARNDQVQRELVFNPGTGEILRDYAVSLASLDAGSEIARSGNDNDVPAQAVGGGLGSAPPGGGVTSPPPVLSTDPGSPAGGDQSAPEAILNAPVAPVE